MYATSKAVIETIGDNGYRVEIGYTDALPIVVAIDLDNETMTMRDSHRFIVLVE